MFFGFVGNCLAWQTEFNAEGRIITGITNKYSAIIGEADAESILPSAPATPQYTTLLYIKSTEKLYKDVRQVGPTTQIWTLFFDTHGNVGIPDDPFEATLSWDPSTFGTDGTYQLIGGENGTGDVLIADMRTTTSYTLSGTAGVLLSVVVTYEDQPCATEHTIELRTGWNMIGTYVDPDPDHCQPDMLDIASSLIGEGSLNKIVNNEGKSVVKFLTSWRNSIGNFIAGQGYRVKVLSDTTLTITGDKISLPMNFPLQAGWNMIGYPSANPQDALAAVQKLIDEGSLVKVVNNEGKSIVKFLTSWRNSIGDFLKGEGYRIKVLSDTNFDINKPANTNARSRRSRTLRTVQTPSHFTKIWDGGATNPMTIYVISATINDSNLVSENEIAVINTDSIVGAEVVSGEISMNNPLEIITSKDDGTGNGFIAGNTIGFKMWNGTKECTDITASYKDLEGNAISAPSFTPDGGYIVSLSCTLPDDPAEKHCTPVWDGGATNPMTLYAISVAVNGNELSSGEVCVYNGDDCVGASVLNGVTSIDNPLEIITSKDDGTGNGFTPGHDILFKIWDGQNECTNVTVSYMDLEGNSISTPSFTADEGYIVSLSCGGTSPPEITSISPDNGDVSGGTDVVIAGSNFVDGLSVAIGGTNATNVVVNSSTQISCKIPQHTVGAVDVVVTNPDSQSDTLTNGFTYTEESNEPHCVPVWDGGATNPMTIYAISAKVNGNEVSSGEICISDGSLCVGAESIDGVLTIDALLEIITSKDDGTGNGFTPGNDIIYTIWDGDKECTNVTASYMDLEGTPISTPTFTPDEGYIVSLACVTSSPPTITITGANPITVEKCTTYTELGATATDPADGDISGDIVIINSNVDPNTVGTYSVTYNVQNSKGVSAEEKVRVVNVVDTTDPVITILGDNPMIIAHGSTFNDPGATAIDPNCETDLTDQINTTGSVNTSTPGDYNITYSVSDSSGNSDSKTRVVTVSEPLVCNISVSPASHNFGSLLSQTTQIFTISNSGDGACHITNIAISGQNASSFDISNDNCSAQTLNTSDNCTLSVVFPTASATTGDHVASLDIPSNDPDIPTYSVSLQGLKTENPCYPFTPPKITSSSMDLYGVIYDSADTAISDNDVVAAFVDDGNGGQIVVGCGLYGENMLGTYGLHIYGDDDVTTEKDGVASDDTIILKTYDVSEAMVYTASVVSGDPSWSVNNFKEVDWKIRIKQSIPLVAGWNLISFSVNNCYYVDQQPTVPMLDGIEYIQVSSIDEILASLNNQFLYVRGFDAVGGGKDYNKTPLSDLKYMAAGYGYWIKIDENADFDENGYIYLELEGVNVTASKQISLSVGWNLIGQLGNQINYIQKPTVPFTKIVINDSREPFAVENPVTAVSDIFQAIDGSYSSIRGSDLNGAKSFYPAIPQISDLRYTGPGYGYWIKITDDSPVTFTWQ